MTAKRLKRNFQRWLSTNMVITSKIFFMIQILVTKLKLKTLKKWKTHMKLQNFFNLAKMGSLDIYKKFRKMRTQKLIVTGFWKMKLKIKKFIWKRTLKNFSCATIAFLIKNSKLKNSLKWFMTLNIAKNGIQCCRKLRLLKVKIRHFSNNMS